MNYFFEMISDTRFQELCQSLLIKQFPKMQCLPVDQPDGGRDAFVRRPNKKAKGLIAFQVKWVNDPLSKDSREFISEVIEKEKHKVRKLIERGATEYYLLTNVRGTSHLDAGSIDKVEKRLTETFGIESYCWWRDDLERRLDSNPEVKWSFPDILRATDAILPLLLGNSEPSRSRWNAIKSFLATQYANDFKLKFKQVELDKNIVDLFVDVPIQFLVSSEEDLRHLRKNCSPILVNEIEMRSTNAYMETGNRGEPLGALELLLRTDFTSDFKRVVIEGAPGQGKSTITQYLCQLHRMLLLGKDVKISRDHKPKGARVPFRVDLRDYATWLAGRNPYTREPIGSNAPVLEAFLAAQVRQNTGVEFSVNDFLCIAQESQILIVLDGFDEVADTALRDQIISEASGASNRIDANSYSSQMIVTSRPAAFANSPGFPREEWSHFQIVSLPKPTVVEFAKKWLAARNTSERDRKEVLRILEEKLHHPHIRDLARNPMQLTILMSLISVQGVSLPDKRTSLYDEYIKIFFNREAEKSDIVKNHRDLLINIHRYLAWLLQIEAETKSSAGYIEANALREVLRSYLDREGHSTDLADRLFTGMTERVVALVSRVQGTYEFEVQPLREYFCARYLYDTAPYRPQGGDTRGTLPKRFEGIAQNFYWLNVTRFYAGCYNTGELASLLEGLEHLSSLQRFRYISHVPRLAVMLISDYVLHQTPRLLDKFVRFLLDERSFRLYLASRADTWLTLLESKSRDELVDRCKAYLLSEKDSEICFALGEIINCNTSSSCLMDYWQTLRSILKDDKKWLSFGWYLKVFSYISSEQALSLMEEVGDDADLQLYLRGRDTKFKYQHHHKLLLDIALSDRPQHLFYTSPTHSVPEHILLLGVLLSPDALYNLNETAFRTLRTNLEATSHFLRLQPRDEKRNKGSSSFPARVADAMKLLLDSDISSSMDSEGPWSQFIESVRGEWGERWSLCKTAVFCTQKFRFVATDDGASLLAKELPLLTRVNFARQIKALPWWRAQLSEADASGAMEQAFALLSANSFLSIKLGNQLAEYVEPMLDKLPQEQWGLLVKATREYYAYLKLGRCQSKYDPDCLTKSASPRLACLLLLRSQGPLAEAIHAQYLSDYDGNDPIVHQAAIDFAITKALNDNSLWSEALRVIVRGYKNGAARIHGAINAPVHSSPKMTVEVAETVCANAPSYPLHLVKYAEGILAQHTGVQAKPVGHIATEECWFCD
jgi:hypothetical protein